MPSNALVPMSTSDSTNPWKGIMVPTSKVGYSNTPTYTQSGAGQWGDAWGNNQTANASAWNQPTPTTRNASTSFTTANTGNNWLGDAFAGAQRTGTGTNPLAQALQQIQAWQQGGANNTGVAPMQSPYYGLNPTGTPTSPNVNYGGLNQTPTTPTSNTTFAAGTTAPTGNPAAWLTGQPWMQWNNQDWAQSTKVAQALQNMNQYLPVLQAQQNAYQYGQDFNEAQRRWDTQFQWQQQGDQFAQNLANTQEQRAAWTAQQAANQWNQQFGLDTELGRGNLANQQQQTYNTGVYQQGQLANQAQVNRIDEAYKQGLITDAQRQTALKELTQRQTNEFNYAKMAQDAALQREALVNQAKIANIQAFGREQAPQARWLRAW